MKIWEEETNAKGGLLGRPVKLIYYDDQSNPSTVPGIYTKLLDVDKVETAESTTRNASSSKSPRGNDSETPLPPASNGCSQPPKPAPKWAVPIPTRSKSHNHCAEVLGRSRIVRLGA
jgi:hypothetical protein